MTQKIFQLLKKFEKVVNKSNFLFLGIILFILFLISSFPLWNVFLGDGDISEYLNNPLRVLNGEFPYRDFWLIFPPGEVYLPVIIYKFLGLNINYVLLFSIMVSSLTGFFSFLLGKQIYKENMPAMICALLVFFNGLLFHNSGPVNNHIYFLFLMISVSLLFKYLHTHSFPLLFFSGVFCGLSFLFRYYETGAGFLAFLIVIFLSLKFEKKTTHQIVYTLFLFFAGTFMVLVLALFPLHEIGYEMIKEVVLESLSHGTSLNRPYFTNTITYWVKGVMDIENFLLTGKIVYGFAAVYHIIHLINVTLSHLLPFILAGVTLGCFIAGNINKNEKIILLLFFLWGIFTFPKAWGRSDMSHLSPSTTPLFFLLIFFIKKNKEEDKLRKKIWEKFIKKVTIITTFFLLLPVPLIFAKSLYPLIKPGYEISTAFGSLRFSNKAEAKNFDRIIHFINKNTSPNDFIFVTPWFSPPFYALTNRKNPAYYDSMIDLIGRPSDEKQLNVCNSLTNHRAKLIIHNSNWGFGNAKKYQFLFTCPLLQKCIEDNFELAAKYGNYKIYLPRQVYTE